MLQGAIALRLTELGFLGTQRQEEEPLNFTAIDTRKEQCYLFPSVVHLLEILFYFLQNLISLLFIFLGQSCRQQVTRTTHTREVTAEKSLTIALLTYTSTQLELIHKQAEVCEFVRFCLFFPL